MKKKKKKVEKKTTKNNPGRCHQPGLKFGLYWRRRPGSNRGTRICNPLRSLSATAPGTALREGGDDLSFDGHFSSGLHFERLDD